MLYLDLALQLALEAAPYDLSLTGLQTIRDRWNRANVVRVREQNELAINEVRH